MRRSAAVVSVPALIRGYPGPVDLGRANRVVDPWIDEMNRRSTTLFAHPGPPPNFDPNALGMNVALFEFMFESARMVANNDFAGRENAPTP
jgi:hypothetical protein